ncbi:glycosyltransferase family 15 protein [Pholiota molesta]|nr:glycosyltransferase family 15 protein [Pholiota molesta]
MGTLLPSLQLSPRRIIFLVFVFVISLHYLLTVVFKTYTPLPSFTQLGNHLGLSKFYGNSTATTDQLDTSSNVSLPIKLASDPAFDRVNATFVFLCRNNDINGAVSSIQQMEDRFNKRHGYPWVLLNEEPFTDEFKMRVSVLTDAPIYFGQIQAEHWHQPSWIDEEKAIEGRLRMMAQGIIYAGSVPYRNMCRFNSGFFFKHELLKPYRYYWRVEPDVKFFCDMNYDPFKFMQNNDKVYGFTISLVEWEATIPTLWSAVKEFIRDHPEYINQNNSMEYLSDNGGETYNLCHFWSNFEIADMDLWRGEAYQKFFDYLETKGGFYYERWGDAPVHSIAAALFARKDQLHFFRDIGYRHDPFQHCPTGNDWIDGRCSCDPNDSFDYAQNSCIRKYEDLFSH